MIAKEMTTNDYKMNHIHKSTCEVDDDFLLKLL